MNIQICSQRNRLGAAVIACFIAGMLYAQQPAQTRPATPTLPAAPAGTDEIVLRNGSTYRGKVLSATAGAVKIELPGRGAFDVPREQIDRLAVAPPAAIVKGIQAFERGSMKEAIATLKIAVFQFQGLDTDWATKGLLAYAGASLADQNYSEAEKAYSSFVQWYPDHDLVRDASIGMADVDVARKKYDAALSNLLVMIEIYDAILKPEGEPLKQAAHLNLALARCYEGMNRPEDALDAYTKVIALYPCPEFYPKTLYESALLAARLGRFRRADLLFNELLDGYKDFPEYRDAMREQGNVRRKLAEQATTQPQEGGPVVGDSEKKPEKM